MSSALSLCFSDTTHRVPVAGFVVVCGVDIAIVVEVQVVCVVGVARIRRSRPAIAVLSDIVQRPTIVATIANSRQVNNLFMNIKVDSENTIMIWC